MLIFLGHVLRLVSILFCYSLTALHTTVLEGDIDKTRMLLEFGALIDVKNDYGETPLFMAEALSQEEPHHPKRSAIFKLLQAKHQRMI